MTIIRNLFKYTKLSSNERATDQNPDYESSTIYDSMENEQQDTKVIFFEILKFFATVIFTPHFAKIK